MGLMTAGGSIIRRELGCVEMLTALLWSILQNGCHSIRLSGNLYRGMGYLCRSDAHPTVGRVSFLCLLFARLVNCRGGQCAQIHVAGSRFEAAPSAHACYEMRSKVVVEQPSIGMDQPARSFLEMRVSRSVLLSFLARSRLCQEQPKTADGCNFHAYRVQPCWHHACFSLHLGMHYPFRVLSLKCDVGLGLVT
eukprot:1027483-Pelagomonas_calceolata.AAC.2